LSPGASGGARRPPLEVLPLHVPCAAMAPGANLPECAGTVPDSRRYQPEPRRNASRDVYHKRHTGRDGTCASRGGQAGKRGAIPLARGFLTRSDRRACGRHDRVCQRGDRPAPPCRRRRDALIGRCSSISFLPTIRRTSCAAWRSGGGGAEGRAASCQSVRGGDGQEFYLEAIGSRVTLRRPSGLAGQYSGHHDRVRAL